ncbi:unnamed protein product [Prunus armeniaca]
MPPHSIVNSASSKFKVGISRMKAYRKKVEALQITEGTVAEQYAMLWDYCHELEDKIPSSTTKMHCEFVDDACHLKGVYDGQLLTAVGIYPNNETWVLAYAVVEMETRESWTWFIDLLAKDVDIVNSHGWVFIFDKQKGLPGAFEDIVPNAETRFCVRHLWDNFNKTYKCKVLRDQLWTCARAINVPCFNYQIEVMKTFDSNAWEWLAEKPPIQWSKSHFRTNMKCDMLQNNLCENFNNNIKIARDKPIITMLEMIRKWDLSDIPSAHGIVAIHYKGGKAVEDYVHSYYSKDSYMALYNNLIMPINGSQLWEKTNHTAIKPLAYTRQPGRPRNVRIKRAKERIDKTGKKWLGRQGMQMRCNICASTGHDKTTHHQNIPQKEKPLSRGKGRPRKIPNQDPAVAADEAKATARVRRKLAYARAKAAAAAAKKAALNASQPNAVDTAGIGLRASKRQRT